MNAFILTKRKVLLQEYNIFIVDISIVTLLNSFNNIQKIYFYYDNSCISYIMFSYD